jgi:hypothetical protein
MIVTPRISVIAPTRTRTSVLDRMLQTLVTTAAHPDTVEVVLRCDWDDDESLSYVRACQATGWLQHTYRHGASHILGSRLHGYATVPVFVNEAARLSHADLVFVVNDDVEFRSPGWDGALVDAAAAYPDGLFDLAAGCVTQFAFPCVSRRQITLLGGVFDERLVYPDLWLRDVLMPFGRAMQLPQVRLSHNWVGQSADQQRACELTRSQDYAALYAQCVQEGRTRIREELAASGLAQRKA